MNRATGKGYLDRKSMENQGIGRHPIVIMFRKQDSPNAPSKAKHQQ
jgi:hypothetical protein